MSLFGELKRRNVFRVAIAYSVVAWLVAQVAELALDSFGSPDWVMKTLLLLLAIGLPIAIVFAWAFEMTPEGVKREKDVDRTTSITQQTGRKINTIIISVLVIALGFSVVTHRWTGGNGPQSPSVEVPSETAASGDQSIAVLPFVNMSDDAGNEYFSDGISEELLNVLVRVEGLRVASRTSSFAFKGKDTSIPNIAESLGVEHILEGSVRKAGNTVRVTAQLIDARTDTHLWSETYDRKLEDIFAIQDEISGHIVEALKVALGAGGEQAITKDHQPTQDLDAYENYLRGRYLWQRRGGENIAKSIALFEKATSQDPTFARAWSSLAAAHLTMPTYSNESNEVHNPKALKNAKKALEIDPTIAEAYAVLAELARADMHWDEAENYYHKAIEMEPKNSTSHLWYAEHLQSTGRTEAALKEALIAYELDPLHPGSNSVVGAVYEALGDVVNREKYSRNAWQLGHWGSLIDVIDLKIQQGKADEALALAHEFEATVDDSNGLMIVRVNAYVNEGARQDFFDVIEAPDFRFPRIFFLNDYAMLRSVDDVFALTTDVNDFTGNSMFQLWRTDMAHVRRDPRFVALVKAAGLETYWDEYGWPPACQKTDGQITCH